MIHTEPNTTRPDDQQTEREREHIVGVVWRGRQVQKEDEVDSHLRDGKRRQSYGDSRSVNNVGSCDPEGRQGQQDGETEAQHIGPQLRAVLVACAPLVVIFVFEHVALCVRHSRVPTK